METPINFILNDLPQHIDVDPNTPLLAVLRNNFGLVGAKAACGLEQCGACLVMINGAARPSCKLPIHEASGKEIRTIEGLSPDGLLHRVQQAFIEEQALQCGFCTAGFVVAAAALLEARPEPTDDEIRAALDRNLCRCGVYPRIFRAVRRAAGRPLDTESVQLVTRHLDATRPRLAHLSQSFEKSPDLDQWLRIDPEKTITLFAGKVEYGQGILTALAQVAAEELEVHFNRMRVVPAATGRTPDEGMTVGSMSLMTTGTAVQIAAADARLALLSMASEDLEARMEELVIKDGMVTDRISGRSTTYWRLLAGHRFGRKVTGKSIQRSPSTYKVLGKRLERLDLMAKITGKPAFLHDFQSPGLLHARVLRPSRPGARLIALETGSSQALPGVVRVLRDGSFVAVVADNEYAAESALKELRMKAAWEGGPELAGGDNPAAYLKTQPAQSFHIVDGTPSGEPVPGRKIPDDTDQVLRAAYTRPFQMHASLGPSAAIAMMEGEQLTLWVHSQGVYPIRRYIAAGLGMDENRVSVQHMEGPGCYGHNGADDAAFDAALIASMFPGSPISVKWTRADEHRWEPYAPAMAIELEAALGKDGKITGWDHQVWSYPHSGRSSEGGSVSALLSSWYVENPSTPPEPLPSAWNHAGGYRNADPLYVLPNKRIVKHFVPERPLRTSSMRGLGAFANIFAIESFMDELAHAAGKDPLEFRLAHLEDVRGREVLRAAAKLADWEPAARPANNGRGRGLAFARYKNRAAYCAVVVDVEIDTEGGIRLIHAHIAADAGQIVNPDGLANQLEGGFIQAASWTLKEAVRYSPEEIESVDWESYPILRFSEAPTVQTVLLNRPGAPFLGSGEASAGPTGAAIANAIFDATGKRVRDLPILRVGSKDH